MKQQRHIINRQILEVQLPKTVDAFGVQQELGKLYRDQWLSIIDTILCKSYSGDETKQLQIERITIDLGVVAMKDITTVFAEKFKEEWVETISEFSNSTNVNNEKINVSRNTPLRVVSHYLKTGILPWWAGDGSKEFLQDQLELLIKTKNTTFRQILGELRFNTNHLERFLNTFTEDLILASLQLITPVPVRDLLTVKRELLDRIKKNVDQSVSQPTHTTIVKTFWKSVFYHIPTIPNFIALKEKCTQQTLLELGIHQKPRNKENQNVFWIRSLIEKYRTQYTNDSVWQQFFNEASKIVNNASFYEVKPNVLREFRQLLINLEKTQQESPQAADATTKLQSLAKHLQVLQTSVKELQKSPKSLILEKQQSSFEDTDFITVQNAGLILFWPFLQRFFENLDLLENKTFRDEVARNRAICAL